MIIIEESFELLLDTLSRFDEQKLNLNDDELTYEIFDDLDSEYHTFLHEWTVNRLFENDLIKSTLRDRIFSLRKNINSIIDIKTR